MAARIRLELEKIDDETGTISYSEKEFSSDGDLLYLPDVLRLLTEGLRGFGYVISSDEGLAVIKVDE